MTTRHLLKCVTILCVGALLCPQQVHGQEYSISADYIRGEGRADGIKLAIQYHSDYLRSWSEHLHLYFESSVNFWQYGAGNQTDTNLVLSLSPVIQYPVTEVASYPLYIEFGIGVALLSDTRFAGKDVGSHYQFEDRLGLVTRFGIDHKNQLALRYFHYSNAGLKKPNPGLDFISLSYLRRF